MKRIWATSGLDLHLELSGKRVTGTSLESAMRTAVREGRLRVGTRIPSTRALARDLGLSRNTVADAYGQLVAEGWLATRVGSGTWVAERPSEPASRAAPAGSNRREPGFDLRPGVPDLSAFPRSAWLSAARRALAVSSPNLMGYADPQGLPQLRAALADYLSRVRGVVVTPERIVICAGFAQGLELVCRVLSNRGTRSLAVEAFGHQGHQHIAERADLTLNALQVDSGGAVIDEVAGNNAILLTPAHQFPIGVPLAPARRRQAVHWATHAGALIIEDDYDGEFRYDRQPIGAMQALAPESIVYAGTASKSLVPGLRLAWLVLPAHLVEEVVAHKAAARALSSSIEQLTLAEFITSGALDRHIRQVRLAYRRRRDHLVAALGREVPGVRVTGIAAGLQALITLMEHQDEEKTVRRALEHGLLIEGLGTYSRGDQAHPPALVIGYARPPAHAFNSAVARLCALLRE